MKQLLTPKWMRWLRSSSSAAEVARQRQSLMGFYGGFIHDRDLCFDVGATLGNRTAALLGIGARVICIEPQPRCIQKLKRIFGKHPDVIIVEKGLASMEGRGKLAVCEEEPAFSTMSDQWRSTGPHAKTHSWNKVTSVELTTLDRLISCYGAPTFCNIDVAGFEAAVVRGLSIPIPIISFKFAKDFFDDAKACMNYFQSLGSVSFNVSLGESVEFLWQDWVAPDAIHELVETSGENLLWGAIYARFS